MAEDELELLPEDWGLGGATNGEFDASVVEVLIFVGVRFTFRATGGVCDELLGRLSAPLKRIGCDLLFCNLGRSCIPAFPCAPFHVLSRPLSS